MGADPFLRRFGALLGLGGLLRACADDVGAVIYKLQDIAVLVSGFRVAERLAHLCLDARECKQVPVAAAFSDFLAQRYE
eukprot:7408967-Pyramimonas_sp.AAC.1